jgi:hypothetical protein
MNDTLLWYTARAAGMVRDGAPLHLTVASVPGWRRIRLDGVAHSAFGLPGRLVTRGGEVVRVGGWPEPLQPG